MHPTKDDARGLGSDAGIKEKPPESDRNSACGLALGQITDKQITTAVAQAALAGVAVHRLADGRLLAVMGVATPLDDLEALQAFLARLGGAA